MAADRNLAPPEPAVSLSLLVNGTTHTVEAEPNTPLLWVLRDHIGLVGTKYGCGVAECGSCTVHVDGVPQRSCDLSVSSAVGKQITTIEGLSEDGKHPVQQAWQEVDVPQCGYCQAGQLMSAAALIDGNPSPTDKDIDEAMDGVLCRCGTYVRIRKAIHRAAEIART